MESRIFDEVSWLENHFSLVRLWITQKKELEWRIEEYKGELTLQEIAAGI